MYYYKTNDAAAVAAFSTCQSERAALIEAGERLCRMLMVEIDEPIDIKPQFGSGISGRMSFLGVSFSNGPAGTILDEVIWRKATQANSYVRNPRTKVPASFRELQAKLGRVWKQFASKKHIDADAVYKSVGVNWGDFVFGGGKFTIFIDGDTLFMQTSVRGKAPILEEILASTFHDSKARHDAAKVEAA